MNKNKKFGLLNEVFSPTAPIEKKELFFGRLQQVSKVQQAVEERGQHAVLYGERGVGKTSLANIISEIFPNLICSKVTCNRTENFKAIWQKALSKIRFISSSQGFGFNAAEKKELQQLDFFLPDVEYLDSTHIEHVFENLDTHLLLVFDEFDSINENETKIKMADTIKALSDNIPNVTLLIVGIADSVTDLIGDHPSIERCLLQIKMPRMSNDELLEIINNGIRVLKLNIDENVSNMIVEYSSGFPHYTHLLCKYAAYAVIENDEIKIENNHFDYAVNESIENAHQSLRNAYQKATISSKGKTQFEDVIISCAIARTDEYQSFSSNDIIERFNEITNRNVSRESINYNLGMLCKPERGSILEKIGTSKNIRYKFKNPLMLAFVKLKLHAKQKSNLFFGS